MKNYLFAMVLVLLIACNNSGDDKGLAPIGSVTNGSFEVTVSDNWDSIDGWEGSNAGGVSDDGYYAPVDGNNYAYLNAGEGWVKQKNRQLIEAGKSYILKGWTRSTNKPGNTAETIAEIAFLEGNKVVKSTTNNVNVKDLKGIAATYPNDDGGNVWIDRGYRHQFADAHFIQDLSLDPINDPWEMVENSPYQQLDGLGFAVGNVIAGNNKYIYGTLYRDIPGEFYSSITLTEATDASNQTYTWTEPRVILDHEGSEFPWVLDAHLFYDEETNRLWMIWGGGVVYVAEMDPATGDFLNVPEDTEYDTHPEDMHTPVATWPETRDGWCGDDWSSCWMEGAALYKYDGRWYFFGSYGNLGANYTIRMGRGDSPTGPFYDKNGINLMEFDEKRGVYGQSMLLGDEGEHRVPGHPHLWEENGKYFMGYDYRKDPTAEPDLMGIRRIHWVDGWPTVWTPIEVRLTAEETAALDGKALTVAFRNKGEAGSVLAIDKLEITEE